MSKTTYDDKQNIKDEVQYLWDKGLLSAEIKDDKVIRRYVYLDIMPVAVLDYGYDEKGKLNETKVYSIHTDHLGTPKQITNQNQETVWSIEMDTFGETQSIQSKDNFQFNLRFAGQYFDQETGYHYNYHRYYDPKTGRYLTSDPIGLWSGDTNTYIYVNNQPWYGIDLWGLYAISQVDYMRLVGVTDKALAGRMFDADMNASNYLFFHNTTKFNSSYRTRMTLPRSQKFTSVIPDNTGIFAYTKLSRNPYTVLKNISINKLHFEFKLTSTKSLSISYNDYQLSGMIDVLQKNKYPSKK
ncbi:RHS repeat domain-containing protein [Moraxella nonliquefaciens]|uniref:RHS repeat domain-containing protein n=1 Tax=Moraxella nonliquefaciens TaxID=478 RepID=UPI0011A48AA2|nr:RHS repeat-associated core domain-containing protein [Moraxella nonliquefaciens]